MKTKNYHKNNIQFARKMKGLSQSSLGFKLGVTRQTVANYESGDSPIPSDILLNLSEIFSCSLDWLMRNDEASKIQAKGINKKRWATPIQSSNLL